ncbi:MAG: histidine kinase dimerization/phospho-acceptor domain-containing protein, partial [Mariprofundus sp.]
MFTSLQRKLLAMILSAAIICTGIMGGAWYQSHFAMLETTAKKRLQAEAALIAELARQVILDRNTDQANQLLEQTLSADDNFHAIHLLLSDYSTLAAIGDPVVPRLWLESQQYGHEATDHHVLHPVLEQGQTMGYVLIELDPLVLVKDKEAAFYVMLLTMFISMIFAIGIFIVYRNQVSQPLSRVADRMKELLDSDPLSQWMDAGFGADHPGFKRLPVESDDEVGKLISAFNSLLQNLETNFEQVYSRYSEQQSNLNQFREMTEASPIPIVITRVEDGQMLFHNPAALALVDDKRPNPEGKNISEYYLDPAARRRLRRLLQARGVASNYELKARRKSGGKLWLSVSVRTIQYHSEAAYLAVIADLTERKKQEDQLRQFNEKLEKTIKARTKDLNKARKAAESSSQAKGEFLANMSHEIRTPMNAVIGFAHLVLDTDMNAMQRDYVGKMLAASEDLLGVINDILDFSKVEAGKLEMEHIAFDLSKTLENVASIAGIKAEEKGLNFLLDYPPDMPTHLIGDPL